MFKALQSGTLLDVPMERILSVRRSSGTCAIAIGSATPRVTRAWILTTANLDSTHAAFVYLQVVDGTTFGGMLFRADPEHVPASQLAVVEQEALDMVQGQGFRMETLAWADLAYDGRLDVLSQLPFPAELTSRPTINRPPGLPPAEVESAPGLDAQPFDISSEISLPDDEVVRRLGRLLALF